ncbi:hypothetical protein HanXRQr2_Chr07g0295061 [Helianthus annuus]|uniref:Uncharacterized protein n=1 Tax=Helianthus annuus TaxID=4232 RepID=A0A9K3IKF7_HELAN|nr:hypothetical protein HanXRQr2_Chr07g0295061 [Helianthus annuus]KAJ0904731.1 hypothetical protein HanPSC8_Chr07g0285641 [Helianthus annuus]
MSSISRRLNRWITLSFGHSYHDIRATLSHGQFVLVTSGSLSAQPLFAAAEFGDIPSFVFVF